MDNNNYILKRLTVVGLKFYINSEYWKYEINLGNYVEVKPEPINQYDKNAMAVYHNDKKVGYVCKNENLHCEPGFYKISCMTGFSIPVVMNIIKLEDFENE